MLAHPVFFTNIFVGMKKMKGFKEDIICLIFHNSWQFLQQMIIYQQRKNSRYYMLTYPVSVTEKNE